MSYSEDRVRAALHGHEGMLVYKPPDDARNWKPADFLCWWGGELVIPGETVSFESQVRSAMLEVKQNPLKALWHVVGTGGESLRPNQLAAAKGAWAVGLPYVIAVYWKQLRRWSIHRWNPGFPDTMSWHEAVSRYGVEAEGTALPLILRGVLEGDASL